MLKPILFLRHISYTVFILSFLVNYSNGQYSTKQDTALDNIIQLHFVNSYTGYGVIPEKITIEKGDGSFFKQILPSEMTNAGTLSTVLKNGSYTVTILSTEYQEMISQLVVDNKLDMAFEFNLDPKIVPNQLDSKTIQNLHHDDATLIVGYVVDNVNRSPIKNVKVSSSVDGNTTMTDALGYFNLYIKTSTDLNLEKPSIRFEKEGFIIQERQYLEITPNGDLIYRIKLERGVGTKIIDERKNRRRSFEQSDDTSCINCYSQKNQNEGQTNRRTQELKTQKKTRPSNSIIIPATIRVGRSCTGTTCNTIEYYSIETYAKHVLPAEWISTWGSYTGGINSLKAGAVAVRTYGLWYIYNPLTTLYDICDNTYCQVFGDATSSNTNTAVEQTIRYILTDGSGNLVRSEYSAENNNKGCGDGYSGTNTSWPCISDMVCSGKASNGHGRGMCQWGSARWATGLNLPNTTTHSYGTKDWQEILNHYYSPKGWLITQGATASITNATPSPATVNPGGTFTINLSLDATATFNVIIGASIQKSGLNPISDSPHDKVITLSAGTSTNTRFFTVPVNTTNGQYDLIVALWFDKNSNDIIDVGDQVIDAHAYSQSLTVSSPGSLPDLTVSTSIGSSYTSGQANAQLPVTLTRNGGNLTSGQYVDAHLFWSVNSTWDLNDTRLWRSYNSSPYDFPNDILNTNGSKTVTATFNIPSVSSGTYYIIAVVDSSNYHSESNESNNTQAYPVSITQSGVGALMVSPAENFSSSGFQGGPFTPSGKSYTLTNTGTSSINWTITKVQSWLDLTQSSGSLGAGNSTNITATVNSNAISLIQGSYSDNMAFTNTSNGNGNTSRTVSLTVNQSQTPIVNSNPTSLNFTAQQGGSNPASQILTISNSGSGTLNWSLSDDAYWLTETPASGTNTQQIFISVDVSNLVEGTYTAQLTVTAPGASNSPWYIPISVAIVPEGVFDFTWQGIESMPQHLGMASSVVYQNKLHVVGGTYALAHYVYDPSTTHWITMPDIIGNGSSEGASGVIGNKMYILDGVWSTQLLIYDFTKGEWSYGHNIPTQRKKPIVITVNNKLYVIGGTDNNYNGLSTVEEYDPSSDSWTTKANLPTPRGYAGGVVIENLIYIIGGRDGSSQTFAKNIVEVYDPKTNTWNTKNPMPTRRAHVATTVLNNKVYVIGGMDESGTFLRTVEEFDPIANSWRTASPITATRFGPTAGTILGKIYVAGGENGTGYLSSVEEGTPVAQSPEIKINPSSLSFSTTYGTGNPPSQSFVISNYGGGNLNWNFTKDVSWLQLSSTSGTNTKTINVNINSSNLSEGYYEGHVSVTATGATNSPQNMLISLSVLPIGSTDFSWQNKSTMPQAKYGAAYATINGKIHVIGGGGTGTVYTHYSFDPSTNIWSTLASPPDPFGVDEGAAVGLNGKIYVISAWPWATSKIGIYNPNDDSWSFGSAMKEQRRVPSMVEVNGKIYVIGGANGGLVPIDSVEEYNPLTNQWISKAPMPTPRYGTTVAVVNNLIYVMGGNTQGNSSNAVEIYDPVNDTWSTKHGILYNIASRYSCAVTRNNKIYLLGGQNNQGTQPDVSEYNPAIDTLTWGTSDSYHRLSPMQKGRHFAACGFIGDKIYMIGGQDTNYITLNSVEEGTPAVYSISGNLSGIITDDVHIKLEPQDTRQSTTTTTDGSGNYSFGGVYFGDFIVTPFRAGYSFNPPFKRINISGGNKSNQNFTSYLSPINEWSKQYTGQSNSINAVSFSDSQNGWATSNDRIFHTINGGKEWYEQTLPIGMDGYNLYDIKFADSLTGWAISLYGKILSTTNGGNTWTIQFTKSDATFYDLFVLNNYFLWVVTTQGLVIKTTNGGQSWISLNTGFSDLRNICFVDELNGWIVRDGEILATNDGGDTWFSQCINSNASLGSFFIDSKNGWVFGYGHKILHTSNGGINWTLQNLPDSTEVLRAIVASDSSTAWAVGYKSTITDEATIVQTTNAGATWTRQQSKIATWLLDICFVDNFLWATGGGGFVVHRDVDISRSPYVNTRGVDSITYNSAILNGMVNPNSLEGNYSFQCSIDSTLLSSSQTSPIHYNSGRRNTLVSTSINHLSQDTWYYYRIVAQNNKGIKYGKILKFRTLPVAISMNVPYDTLDFGAVRIGDFKDTLLTISNSNFSTNNLQGNISLDGNCFSIQSGGGAFNLAPDSQQTFKIRFQPSSTNQFSGELTIIHNAFNYQLPLNIFVAGIGNYTLGLKDNKLLPSSFSLEQNFPNPFNPTTVIHYSLPIGSYVKLKIFNVLGIEVAQLVEAKQDAGYKSVEWDASKIPSGIYFYKLEAVSVDERNNSFNKVMKMLIVK